MRLEDACIEMAHGSGGRATQSLIDDIFAPCFRNCFLDQASDQALLPPFSSELSFATDSHVISPLFFPGGNIGSLSVYGTVNDVALGGATPLYLSAGFVLEEGFALKALKQIAESMAKAARECGVHIVTGDTKVVEKGRGDGVYINTTGIGAKLPNTDLSPRNIRPGDRILVNGTLGDHGTAILAARNEMRLQTHLLSDSQPLHSLTNAMLEAVPELHALRDPTRGGLSACLNELARTSACSLYIDESQLPVRPEVNAVCELLGLDLLTIANEGKLVAFCPPEQADTLLTTMRAHPAGKDAAIIGEVSEAHTRGTDAMVSMHTLLGGTRLIDWQWADALPRIC